MTTPAPTLAQVKSWIVSLLPPGADKIYSLDDGDGGIGDYFGAIAEAVKAYGSDIVATVREEVNPATATGKLPEWEAATGLTQSRVSQVGSTAERREQIRSKLRESGASTLDNIRAAVQPFFQYDDPTLIEILEVPRADLEADNTYAWAADVIPALGSYSKTVFVPDSGDVSGGGARVWVNITIALVEDVSVTLTAPDATVYTLASAGDLGSGAVTDEQYSFFVPDVAGESINGNWTLTVANASAGAGTVNVGGGKRSEIFVEGIGRVVFSDAQGLGAGIFEFAVAFDPALSATSTPDLMAARAAVQRIQPAHTQGYVVQYMVGGGLCAIVDDANAVVNGCVVC